jgi:hypothetical protein
MQASTTSHATGLHGKVNHFRWQRIIVLFVLGYEGAGALLGGGLLVAVPDGRLMDMPTQILHNSFPDFMIPGIILFAMGVFNTLAFYKLWYRTPLAWMIAVVALNGMLIWFLVEIAILLQVHWLHAMWGLPVVIGLIAAVPVMIYQSRQKA